MNVKVNTAVTLTLLGLANEGGCRRRARGVPRSCRFCEKFKRLCIPALPISGHGIGPSPAPHPGGFASLPDSPDWNIPEERS